MPKTLGMRRAKLMMALLLATGCADSRDDRLAEMAQQSLREQARQNERLTKQSQQIAEASKHLVENDARARKEMIAAHATLQQELQAERANINQQLSELESERREIARQRGRDPILAETIRGVGMTLGCMLPLLLAGYVIYSLNRSSDDSDALSEMLVMEITAEKPKLLPMVPRPVAAIEHAPPPDDDETAGAAASSAD
jgi:hypothetical protein